MRAATSSEPDIRFHELLLTAAHNPVVGRMVSAVNELLIDSRRRTMRIPGAADKATSYHLLVAFAVRDRDADQARAVMEQHVRDVAGTPEPVDRRRAGSGVGPMKALVFRGPGSMPLEDRPDPRPGPGEVVVAVRASGICGSDVHGFAGATGRRRIGVVMGHEAAGDVDRDRPGRDARSGAAIASSCARSCPAAAATAAATASRTSARTGRAWGCTSTAPTPSGSSSRRRSLVPLPGRR